MLRENSFPNKLLIVVVLAVAVVMSSACSPSQAGKHPTLIFFRVDNCPYCKQMAPVVDEIRREYGSRLEVVYAHVDQQQGKDLARQHGIIGYPTILLLDSTGEEFGILRGVIPLESLQKMVGDLLQKEP